MPYDTDADGAVRVVALLEGLAVPAAVFSLGVLARGRGLRHFRVGSLAMGGYVAIRAGLFSWLLLSGTLPGASPHVWSLAAGWSWLLALFIWLRLFVGRGEETPGGLWVCHNCGTTNEGDYVRCSTCGRRWSENGP